MHFSDTLPPPNNEIWTAMYNLWYIEKWKLKKDHKFIFHKNFIQLQKLILITKQKFLYSFYTRWSQFLNSSKKSIKHRKKNVYQKCLVSAITIYTTFLMRQKIVFFLMATNSTKYYTKVVNNLLNILFVNFKVITKCVTVS